MVNRWRGDVALEIDGQRHVMRLTLGALAELEDALEADSLVALIERFETGAFRARDVLALLLAGLRGGGWTGSAADLAQAEIAGGPVAASRAAAELITRAFAGADDGAV
ncbi:gene transfer agent family protein [Pseudaestuariivita atlantica]|uniref:Gene transfer agent protein n=1 Tax=Pseudaestuariivita atlantica TaxID=1317121 RepID=A0A0L1JLY1_9RHOB|nr:gene transfer agent family protein [Pseudaestuariivita atlantica]KNG92764.1 gene transfer agent protein [Pseudaestuariivita atlantica]